MRKTVIELMKEHPKDTFFIGSETSYFFIGNYDEWLSQGYMVTRDMKRNYDEKKKNATRKIPILIKDVERLTSKKEIDLDALTKTTAAIEKNARIKSTEWVDIENRVPNEIRKRMQNDGIILVLPGVESGSFWFRHEYESRYVK